jgi:hypothetical protein
VVLDQQEIKMEKSIELEAEEVEVTSETIKAVEKLEENKIESIGKTEDKFSSQFNLLKKSGALPSTWKNEGYARLCLQAKEDYNLDIVDTLKSVYVINGAIGFSAALMLKLAIRDGHFVKIVRAGVPLYKTDDPSEFYLKGEPLKTTKADGTISNVQDVFKIGDKVYANKIATVAIINREILKILKEFKEPLSYSYFHFTLADAVSADLYPAKSPLSPWNKYTSQMLVNRALAAAIRQGCGYGNFYTNEELSSL